MTRKATDLWQRLCSTIDGVDSPHHLALGMSIGMTIGLVPKESLIPYLLIVFLMLVHANLLTAFLSAVAFSWIANALIPLSHQLGESVLTYAPLKNFWSWLVALPIVPWAQFDNTVVTGSFLLGILASVPLYFISRFICERHGNRLYGFFRNTAVACWLIGPAKRNITGRRA